LGIGEDEKLGADMFEMFLEETMRKHHHTTRKHHDTISWFKE
jgi:hypothetical protein